MPINLIKLFWGNLDDSADLPPGDTRIGTGNFAFCVVLSRFIDLKKNSHHVVSLTIFFVLSLCRLKMVEEGRKSLDVNGAESMAVPVHSLKLKINLRDRQNLRKRRRSVSPDASSDSSSKEQERPSVVMSPSVKKSHKEHRHRNGTDDADSSSMGTLTTIDFFFVCSSALLSEAH